jgi:hypothetical protein
MRDHHVPEQALAVPGNQILTQKFAAAVFWGKTMSEDQCSAVETHLVGAVREMLHRIVSLACTLLKASDLLYELMLCRLQSIQRAQLTLRGTIPSLLILLFQFFTSSFFRKGCCIYGSARSDGFSGFP